MASTPTNGDDVIFGTDADNTINALGGDDLIFGGLGDDILQGSTGATTFSKAAREMTSYPAGLALICWSVVPASIRRFTDFLPMRFSPI